MLGAILSIVPNIIGGVADHFKDKRALKKAQVEGEMAIKKAIVEANVQKVLNGQAAEIEWSKEMAKASATSWKDEWFTIVLSIPAIMSFVPGLAPYVELGFHALAITPDWYQGAFLVAIGASFGVRIWERFKS
jgi:hypothetical protein